MDALFEQHVTRNLALSAFAITQAAIRIKHTTNNSAGLSLFAALLLPPLVFHKRTASEFAHRTKTDGLFYRVTAENRELSMGLQDRLIDMAPRSFRAIHLACSAGLLKLVNNADSAYELYSTKLSIPKNVTGSEHSQSVKTILAASDRLGFCFATTEWIVICAALRVRY